MYKGRVSFAAGNGRRLGAISGGKRNATPVQIAAEVFQLIFSEKKCMITPPASLFGRA